MIDSNLIISNTPLGSIIEWPSNTIPSNYLLCDGTIVATASYPDLFALIGYTYGSAGATFKLPDLRGCVIAGVDNMGGTSANILTTASHPTPNTRGTLGGDDVATISIAQMPIHTHPIGVSNTAAISHSHTLGFNNDSGGSGRPSYKSIGSDGGSEVINHAVVAEDFPTHNHPGTTCTSVGGGSSHNNIQQTLIMNFIIKAL